MDNWITVISFTLPHEAHLAKSKLESEGIKTIIHNELTAQVHNFYSNAIGGVKLLVNKNDKKKAEEILIESGYLVEPELSKTEKLHAKFLQNKRCPYCNSLNFLPKKPSLLSSFILLLVSWIPIPIIKKRYFCFDCGKEWKI